MANRIRPVHDKTWSDLGVEMPSIEELGAATPPREADTLTPDEKAFICDVLQRVRFEGDTKSLMAILSTVNAIVSKLRPSGSTAPVGG